jgi:hypothetical protein
MSIKPDVSTHRANGADRKLRNVIFWAIDNSWGANEDYDEKNCKVS